MKTLLLNRLKAIPRLLFDKEAPFLDRVLLIAGLLYFISPIDIIPSTIPIVHLIDDVLILLILLFVLGRQLDTYIRINPEKDYKGKTIIDAEFSVNSEEDNERIEL